MKRAWAFLLFTVCIGTAAITETHIGTNIGDFFFSVHRDNRAALVGQIQSETLARRYLISVTHADVDHATARKFINSFQQQLDKRQEVTRVWSTLFDQDDIQQLLHYYAPYQRQLFSLQPDTEIAQLLSSESMENQADIIKKTLLGPSNTLAKSLLKDDPMLLSLTWIKDVGDAYKQPERDADNSTFFLETTHAGLDTVNQQVFQQVMGGIFLELSRDYDHRFTLEYTGVPVFAAYIQAQVKSDIKRVSVLSVGLLILLSWLVFRSFPALLCIGIMLFATAGVATLITQWVYGNVHGLTLALGTTLIGICIDYFIHGMVHAGASDSNGRRQAIRRIWPALLVGGATTLIGYIALSFNGFPGLQQLAVFTSSGVLAALLITRYILPDLMGLLRVQIKPRIDFSWLLSFSGSAPLRYLILAIIASVVLLGGPRIQWADDLGQLTPSLQQLAKTDQSIRQRVASIEPGRFILVTGVNTETVLQTSEKVQRQLSMLQRDKKLEAYYPLFPWIASEQLQTQNMRAWNNAMDSRIEEQWSISLRDHGLSASRFPSLGETPTALLTPEQALASPAASLLSHQLISDTNGTVAVIWLGKHQSSVLRDMLHNIPDAIYFSQKDDIQQSSRDYRNKAQKLLVWGLLLILILLSIRYRSLPTALKVLLPATLSIMLLLGLWGLSGASMGILHLTGLLLTAAICVDYAVLFLENRHLDTKRTFQAISISAITTAGAFASLGIAESPALQALAWTVAPGVLAGFLLCPIMLKHNNCFR